MKPNNTNLAKFYGLTRQTIATYKKERVKTYEALKEYFIKEKKASKQNAVDVATAMLEKGEIAADEADELIKKLKG